MEIATNSNKYSRLLTPPKIQLSPCANAQRYEGQK